MVDTPETPAIPGTINIATRDLGWITVPEEQIITFPAGLAGFAQFHRYVLLKVPHSPQFLYLQCVDHPPLAFVVTDPVKLIPDYQGRAISPHVLKEMEATSPQDLQVLVLLTIPAGRPQEITANLMAPLLINPRRQLGKQIIAENSHFPQKYRLLPE